jgi:hypothetical protein
MTQAIVFASMTCTTANPATGLLLRVTEGETWAADDPFVIARPELFSPTPVRVRRTVEPSHIESATKRPGERKAVNHADR